MPTGREAPNKKLLLLKNTEQAHGCSVRASIIY